MFNAVAINPVGTHQQNLQQLQQLLPTVSKPVDGVFHASPMRVVDEVPLDREPHERVEIHSLTDYDPWLKHLYRMWQQQLMGSYGVIPHAKKADIDTHWFPETTAQHIHELALSYLGWLWHHEHWRLLDSMIMITQQWEQTWKESQEELSEAHSLPAVKEVLEKTAAIFHHSWLAVCLKMIEEQNHPDVPPV